MKLILGLFGAAALCLLAGAASAQQAEPGTGSSQLSPASAAPQTQAQPNLRTDSKPHTGESQATDSGPLPETLGMDATPLMDMGPDWSIPTDDNFGLESTILEMHKGQVIVKHEQMRRAPVLPVSNPPEPTPRMLASVPEPPVKQMPTPPDPLSAVSQPSPPQ